MQVFSLVSSPLGPSCHHRSERQTENTSEAEASQRGVVVTCGAGREGDLLSVFFFSGNRAAFAWKTHKVTETSGNQTAEWFQNEKSNTEGINHLLYRGPVLEDVDVSQHVDNERSCEIDRQFSIKTCSGKYENGGINTTAQM